MDISTILLNFGKDKIITEELIKAIQNDQAFRIAMLTYFRQHKDRTFATHLLGTFISIRKQPKGFMPADYLMLACYILGLHNHVEDSLMIWKAKIADFDTYCGLDIQLIVFAGVQETIQFLSEQHTEEGKEAFKYVSGCYESGDFDDIETYFSAETIPWFI